MRRKLLLAVILLALSAAAVVAVFLLTPPKPAAPPPPPPPTAPEARTVLPSEDWHGALNLYVAPPPALPSGTARIELTLIKAELVHEGDGVSAAVFEGGRKLMLQPGVVQKLVSDAAPQGRWTSLRLTFSPAAELIRADGGSIGALLEKREAAAVIDVDLPVSRTLAAFIHLPLLRTLEPKGGVMTLALDDEPRLAETFVLGGVFRDPRGVGGLLHLALPSLAAAVMEDLRLDIRPESKQDGSRGFTVPTEAAP